MASASITVEVGGVNKRDAVVVHRTKGFVWLMVEVASVESKDAPTFNEVWVYAFVTEVEEDVACQDVVRA